MSDHALAVHNAYVAGDVEGLRRLRGDPPDFPNCAGPAGHDEVVLEYAIYHSPLEMIRCLLELGADPNYASDTGFPSLIAALSSARPDRLEIVELLLAAGADIEERGLNDWSALHWAAHANDLPAVRLLLARGADPNARTRIEDLATPLDEAEMAGSRDAVAELRAHREGRWD